MELNETLGERIRKRRQQADITSAELARRAKVSKGYLSAIERVDSGDTVPRPSAEVLFRIATALGTTVADLLGKETGPAPATISPSLREFAEKEELPERDVEMLAQIRFRGQQPSSFDDWRFLYDSIRRSIRSGMR